jgi:nucleoside-diphosphate-sugar epimerase
MATTLVAGATGYLGRHLVAELHRNGHTVRAAVRDRGRAEAPGRWGAPALAGLVDEWAVGDVTDPGFTRDLASGTDRVVSALGVTRQKVDPWEIDNLANLAILRSALEAGSRSFAYVGVLGGDRCPADVTRAKSAFAQTLAAFVVDRLHDGTDGAWDVGGPEVFTWAELARVAFDALRTRPRIVRLPSPVLTPALRMTALFDPRLADSARFTTWNMLHDCVAPEVGTRRLAEFYAEQISD